MYLSDDSEDTMPFSRATLYRWLLDVRPSTYDHLFCVSFSNENLKQEKKFRLERGNDNNPFLNQKPFLNLPF